MPSWTGGLAKAVVSGLIAVSGVTTGAGSGHADGAYACRSGDPNHPGRLVSVVGRYDLVDLDSCYNVLSDGRTIEAKIPFQQATGGGLTYCAHALNVNNVFGPWAHDFGCTSSSEVGGFVWAGGDPPYGPSWSDWKAPAGTYVISTGVWYQGHYHGDVQSPKTTIG
ncbi:hypothetical protein ABZ646_45955 [Streptomyces sp. NPDC007162]|uniref:hypothetical protein n=1 Tax=Streptomyces sp. NPDC007162 TaxID=3156917 RepID=UPI0033CAF1CE